MRENPGPRCLMGGIEAPCVDAAPRANFIQKLSTGFGVTRMNSTGGDSETYRDHSPKSVTARKPLDVS